MNHYKLVIAYDGTNYYGWQEQRDKPSITQELKKTFTAVFGKKISIIGASRTDAGVHALGQIALCRTDLSLSASRIVSAWNNALPCDIVIRSLQEVQSQFHPYFGVKQKTYYYHFFLKRSLPFLSRYGWYYPYPINSAILKKALHFFVGTHDFTSFCSSSDIRKNRIRTIDMINLTHLNRFDMYRITIKGQKFLQHMIRRVVGASIAIASINNKSLDTLQEVMHAKNANHAFPNAPAKGLLLRNIIYY